MIISWKIPLRKNEISQEQLVQIASIVKKGIGFDNEEVKIQENKIIIVPEFGRRLFYFQAFRMALYDLIISKENMNLVFKFRFLTMYVLPILSALFFGAISQSLIVGFIFLGISTLFFIPFKWIQNRFQKSSMESEINQIVN